MILLWLLTRVSGWTNVCFYICSAAGTVNSKPWASGPCPYCQQALDKHMISFHWVLILRFNWLLSAFTVVSKVEVENTREGPWWRVGGWGGTDAAFLHQPLIFLMEPSWHVGTGPLCAWLKSGFWWRLKNVLILSFNVHTLRHLYTSKYRDWYPPDMKYSQMVTKW